MKPPTTLKGTHLRTYEMIFQHPVTHNLRWHDVQALFEHLGESVQEPNGNIKVTRNGRLLTLHPRDAKGTSETDEVMKLRHFLQTSEVVSTAHDPRELQWLMVIDHHEARIFHSELHGGVPHRILPGPYYRHPRDKDNVSKGKEKPMAHSFFEPIASALQPASKILIFGTGTGSSNEMVQFVAWLEIHYPTLAKRIVGSVVIDESHMTEDQLLAKAVHFFSVADFHQS